MRPLIVLLALMLAMPLAMGQGGPGSGQGGPGAGQGGSGQNGPEGQNETRGSPQRECRAAEDQRACMEAYCAEADHPQCQRIAGSDCERADCAELSHACERAGQGEPGGQRACQALQRLDDIREESRFVAFELDQEGRELRNYSVLGRVLVESIAYGDADEEFEVSRHGQRIRFQSGDDRLEVHDSPQADFWFRGDGTLVLRFPSDASLSASPQGHVVSYGDRTAIIAGPDVQVDGQEATATGGFRFFSPAGRGPAGAADALANATAKGHVGAQVGLTSGGADVTAFDDLEVDVTHDPAVIRGNDTLRILVSAELAQGRTIVLDIDPSRLGGRDLALRYYDVHGENLTEVVFRQAGSLADVLDPSDDAGQPEYWIVHDAQKTSVLVSVPHWSAHVIEVASIGQFLVQPSVLLGAAAGVAGVGVAGAAMFWPRRREQGPEF